MTDTETPSFFSHLLKRLNERKHRIRRRIELARLHRIRHKTIPQYTYCKNCGTRLEGMYCYRCGQYALDTEQPFWKYIRQYFENMYQFDGKIWMTLRLMFTRPGFLTNEFNAGKINSYVHPFRLYMCVSVIFFAVFFMVAGDRMSQIDAMNEGRLNDRTIERLQTDTCRADTTIYMYHAPNLVQVLSLRYKMENANSLVRYQLVDDAYGLARATVPRVLFERFTQVPLTEKDWEYIRSCRSLKSLDIENWIDGHDYGPENRAAILAFRIDSLQSRTTEGRDTLILTPEPVYDWNTGLGDENRMLQNEQFRSDIMGQLSKWTPFYLMFLLPLFAWILKVFYHRQRMPYMWHFAHAVHLNTVFLILISIPLIPMFAYGIDVLLQSLQPEGMSNTLQANFLKGTLIGFPTVMFLYLFVSFHTVYRQGWIKTFIKALLFFTLFSTIACLIAFCLIIWMLVGIAETV